MWDSGLGDSWSQRGGTGFLGWLHAALEGSGKGRGQVLVSVFSLSLSLLLACRWHPVLETNSEHDDWSLHTSLEHMAGQVS